jgi:hypothetical protein
VSEKSHWGDELKDTILGAQKLRWSRSEGHKNDFVTGPLKKLIENWKKQNWMDY